MIEHIIPGAVSSSQNRKLMAQEPLIKRLKKTKQFRGTGMARQDASRNSPESIAHDERKRWGTHKSHQWVA